MKVKGVLAEIAATVLTTCAGVASVHVTDAEVPDDAIFDAHTAEKVPTALRCWSNRAHVLSLTNGTDAAEGTGRVFRVHAEGSATALIIQRECPLDETVLEFTYFIPQDVPVKSISAGLRVKEDGGRLTNIRLVPVRGRWHTERFPIARFMQGDIWRAGTARMARHLEIGLISEHGADPIDFDVSCIRLFRQQGPCSPLVRPMQLMGGGTFTRTFTVEGAPTKAWMMALGKPHFRVSVNGRAVGAGGYANAEGWACHNGSSPVAEEYSLKGLLKEGTNTVELTVDAAKDAKGVLALGWVANGRQQVVVTDGDWTCNGKRATARTLSDSAKLGLWDIYPVRPPTVWCPRAERPDYATVPSYRPVAPWLQVHPEEGRWGTKQTESGRWFFKSPSGHPFFFYGMQTVNCFRQNYGYLAWARRTYPTEVAWAEDAVYLVQRLGYNGVGVAASAHSAFAAAARRGMLNLEYVGCADPGPFLVNAQGRRLVGLSDPFDPEWRRRLRAMLAQRAAKLNARPAVFGICVGNEAHIEGNFAGISQAGFMYSPACGAEFVRWLDARYGGDVDALNRAWFGARTNDWFSSFADVLVRKPDPLGKGQSFGDAEHAAAMAHLGTRVGGGETRGRLRADFDAFSVHVVRTYASETLKLMREYFPDKLIGSNRFLGGATEEMYACWKDYDFIAVNSYPMMKWGDAVFTERQLDALRLANRATGRPVLLTEWGVQAMDVNLQSPAAQLYTQAERGRGYEKVLRQVVEELPFVAGVVAFGFQHLADSEGQGWGIVDNEGRPYLDYLDGMRSAVRWLDGFLSQPIQSN